VRVLDLLNRTELGLSVAWADPAMLEREVKGSYIIDLPRPGRFLSEGDLVLTGAQWATGPDSAEIFVSELAAKDVAVLVVGRILIGEIPDYIVTACRSRHIVLLTTSADVSFKSISAYIESAISAGTGTDSRAAAFTRNLLDSLASGQGTQGALRMFYTEFAVDCWLLEVDGTVTAMVGQAPSTERIGAVWNAALAAGADVFVLPDEAGRPSSVYPVVGDGPAGFLVCLGDHRTFSPDMVRVLASLVLVIRVELELANDRRRAAERQAGELVDALLTDSVAPGEAAARMRMLGADPTLPVTVVTAFVDDPDYPARAVLEAVRGMLTGADHLVFGGDIGSTDGPDSTPRADAEVVLLVTGGDPSTEALVRLLDRPAEGQRALLGTRRMRIGISDPTTSVGQLPSALLAARSRMRQIPGSAPIRWSSGANPPSYDALLALLPDRARQTFAQAMLSPLVDYDARHGSGLVHTLRAFLDSGCAWQQAASDLHVHVNTLRYRVGRIETLTGRDLASMRDRVDFFLALECAEPRDPDAA
jgi:hypothetical protein